MRPAGPAVVAIGGGHGLAGALRAARVYASQVTAVVSIADDGGSSGRLIAEYEILPPGDARKCLVALAPDDSLWARALEHRFEAGELAGHALGNLVILGLSEVRGGFAEALSIVEDLLGCEGRVFPAGTERVRLVAETAAGEVVGQAAIASAGSPILRVSLDPATPPAHPDAVKAIMDADQVLLGPGSLFTSVLPPLAVPEIRQALGSTPARRICIGNLAIQPGETDGLDQAGHVAAMHRHGIEFDVLLYDPWEGGLPEGGVDVGVLDEAGWKAVPAKLAGGPNAARHDTTRLAEALERIV